MKKTILILTALTLLVLPASVALAARPLGTYTTFTTASSCPNASPDSVTTTECLTTTISCPDTSDIPVVVKVSAPTSSPTKGTISFGSGGDGRGWYEVSYGQTSRATILNPIRGEGFRIIQISWGNASNPIGWTTGPANDGLLALACRQATLLDALYDRYHTGSEAYCATGQSGASGGLAYALAQYDSETILDHALLSGGPPLTNLDWGCVGYPNDATWYSTCQGLTTSGCAFGIWSCEYQGNGGGAEGLINNSYASSTACTGNSPNPGSGQRATWLGDSILNGSEDVNYPNTHVDIILGASDCAVEPPQARLFRNALLSTWNEQVITGAPHILPSNASAAAAIFATLRDECEFRHGGGGGGDAGVEDSGPPDSGLCACP
jgi:hypothetical protein